MCECPGAETSLVRSSDRRKDEGAGGGENEEPQVCEETEGQTGARRGQAGPALTKCPPCAPHRPSTVAWVNSLSGQSPTECRCHRYCHVERRKPRLRTLRALPEVTQVRRS